MLDLESVVMVRRREEVSEVKGEKEKTCEPKNGAPTSAVDRQAIYCPYN